MNTLCAYLYTIDGIKAAVDEGKTVVCNGGGYNVIKDSHGQYLIRYAPTGYCIGLHGAEGTKYETQLNGSDFRTVE